jgi:hypothetical protein
MAELGRYAFTDTVKDVTQITTGSPLDISDCGGALVVIDVISSSRSNQIKVMGRARRDDDQAGAVLM